jgi:hypothetical protein
MDLVSTILTKAQRYLHDDGTIWPRAELLDYFNNGFVRLLSETDAIRKIAAYDIPARRERAIAYPWERQYGGDFYQEFTLASMHSDLGEIRCTYAWEVEFNAGNHSPSASANACTQPWERIYCGVVEQNDRYIYPGNILSTFRLVFNGIRIPPTSVRELDSFTANWAALSGRPTAYSAGLGRQREFEVWSEVSAYTQSAVLQGRGVIRSITGEKTYSFPKGVYGVVRGIRGTREYICEGNEQSPCTGIPVEWQGSDNAMLLDYSIHAPTLAETDEVPLLPQAFSKYLRYYVIARALGRSGEGENPSLSTHYESKWQMGVKLLHRISLIATSARTYQNKPMVLHSQQPMRPRLPATYPRIR